MKLSFTNLLCALLLALTFTTLQATPAPGATNRVLKGKFSGIITDAQTNLPIAGASVFLVDVKTGAMTDAKGYFAFDNIPEGTHLVEISHVGYTTIAAQVDVTGSVSRNYQLAIAVLENNTVIVTGVGAATQLKKSPFQVSVLRKADLLQSATPNIIEALTKIPGVTTLSTGPAISKPVIRGLGYNRVLTINDNVRQEGQQWGDEHGIEIDQASVSKIEVLKGPASIMYGSDALAGVINVITNVPVENNTIKANVLGVSQSNNNGKAFNANVAGNINGFNWNVYQSLNSAADYRNKYDGRVFNSKFNQNNQGGYVGYNGDWGYSHVVVSNFNLKAGLVEGERDDEGYFIKPVAGGGEERVTAADEKSTTPMIPYQHIRHFKIATDNSFKFGKSRLSLNVGYQRNQREEFGNADDPNERELYFDLKTITYMAQYHLPEMKGWKTSLGVNGMQQENINRGVEQLIPNYKLFDLGGFVYSTKTFNIVTLSGGVRYDTRHLDAANLMEGTEVKNEAFTRNFSNFSASAGIAAQVNKQLNLKLNLARGFRAPSIPELASNGAHEGTVRYEYGDANLKSETSTQLDAGAEFNTEHVSLNVSAFYNNFHNFIFYKKLPSAAGTDSLINLDGDELTAFKFGQTNAIFTGIEANLDIHPHPLDWLHIENSFSITSGRLNEAIEGSKYLPFIPAARLVNEVRCNFRKAGKLLSNLYARLELDNTFAQNRIFAAYNTETATPGYSLLNAGFGADFVNSKGKTIISLHCSGMNLADVAYQNHLSRLKYTAENMVTGRTGVFNMGRNFVIKLLVPLSINLKGK